LKNLFEYATKELSQDAFLCWLFANFDCEQEEVKDFSCYVLSWLISDKLSLENIRQIKNVKILKQYKKIDILVECTFLDTPYIIVIEDKTCSTAHNRQLDRYRETVNSLYNSTYQKLESCGPPRYPLLVRYTQPLQEKQDLSLYLL